ncbi:MAG: hypothetical protein WDZ68_01570, partial [Candidatus Paceibacterota bacterium]
WRQFVYVGGGIGISIILFIFTPFIIFIIFGIPVAALSFMLGFFPVNNRPFSLFLESFYRYFRGTRLYLWRKKGTGIYSSDTNTVEKSPVQIGVYKPPTNKNNLTSLSRKLELNALQKE